MKQARGKGVKEAKDGATALARVGVPAVPNQMQRIFGTALVFIARTDMGNEVRCCLEFIYPGLPLTFKAIKLPAL